MKMWSGIKYSIVMAALMTLLICVMSVPAAAQLADTPWPMFHHNLNHTGLSTGYGPDTSFVNWTFSTGARISGSAVIGEDGTIYIGTRNYQKPKTGSKLYAIYPNGTEKWHWTASHFIDSTPAVASDGTVYMGSWDKCLYALYPNGTEEWKLCTHCGGFVLSSPAIVPDGTIYIGSHNHKLYAIYPNGTEKWNYPTGCKIHSSPAIGSDGTIYVGSCDKKLYAICPNGTMKWSYNTGGMVKSSPAIDADGTIYVGSNDGELYAIYPNGTKKWSYTTGDRIKSSPAIDADGTIYVGSNDGELYAIYPNGTKKWSYTTGDRIKSSPAIDADGTIYVGSYDGYVYAVNPNGTHLWKHYTGNSIRHSSPAIAADGTVYIGNWGGNLYAFGPGTQSPRTPNRPPVLDAIGDKTINETETVTIDLNASDQDGDSLTYSCNQTGMFTDFDPVTGKGNWTTDHGDAGTYYVDFGVSDGKGGIANETIRITVKGVSVEISVVPANTTVQPQDQFDVKIHVDPKGQFIYGVEYYLKYNTSVVRAERQNKGPFLGPIGETIVVTDNIDQTNGVVSYAEAMKDPAVGTDISDNVSTIHFIAIGDRGTMSTLDLFDVIIVDADKKEVLWEPENGTVEITENQPPVANGASKHRINNVAQKYQSTAVLCSCSTDPDYGGKGGNITYIRWAFGDGQYGTSEGLPVDNCTCKEHKHVSWQWEPYGNSSGDYVPFNAVLTVTDDGCPELSNSTFLNVTVYIAGDANGDGKVNVLDAVWVGKHWRETCYTSPPCDPCGNCESYLWDDAQTDGADLNNDCKINVLDAVIIGANWRHTAW